MEHLKIGTQKMPGYTRHHVTGFWGGISPDGEKLNIELFEDAPTLPDELILLFDNEGRVIGNELGQVQYPINRYIHAGVTIPISQLPSIIQWLQSRYDEAMNRKNK